MICMAAMDGGIGGEGRGKERREARLSYGITRSHFYSAPASEQNTETIDKGRGEE